jgi:hypothetical protein
VKCLAIIMVSFATVASATPTDWQTLGKLNDPPGRPSVRAAKVATQGMHPIQIQTRVVQFKRALRDSPRADSVARSVLRREIALLEVALENRNEH